jgi:hypothetical protein
LNFADFKLAKDENDAYRVWMRYVKACLDAERGLGAEITHRVFHDDLVRDPQALIRQILDFLGEPYAPECVQPLAKRINSSPQPAVIQAESNKPLDPELLKEARNLWSMVRTETLSDSSPDAAVQLEEAFERRVEYFDRLDARHWEAQRVVERLQEELDERTTSLLRTGAELSEARKQLLALTNPAGVIEPRKTESAPKQ